MALLDNLNKAYNEAKYTSVVIYRKWQNISLIDELQKSLDVEFTKIFENGYKIHGWT